MKTNTTRIQKLLEPSNVGDATTVLAATIALFVSVLDLVGLLELSWFQDNLTKIILLLVSLIVISGVIERRTIINSLRNLQNGEAKAVKLPSGFANGVIELLKTNKEHESIDIVANSSTMYFLPSETAE